MEIKGIYNTAEVFTNEIEKSAYEQIEKLCDSELYKDSSIKIMPDCHSGDDCVIGTTMTIKDKITPSFLGVDIGCGVTAYPIHGINYEDLDNVIKKYIPHGFGIHKESKSHILEQFGIHLEDLHAHVDIIKGYKSLGTLGGGNHFIEIDEMDDGSQYLIVHSGSRGIGYQVANYWQKQAKIYTKEKYNKFRKKSIERIKNKCPRNLIGSSIEKIPKYDDFPYLEGELMNNYIEDVNMMVRYASLNRIVIIATILYNLSKNFGNFEDMIKNIIAGDKFESIHNYIDRNILRKGAISAEFSKKVIIPLNMADGCIFGFGKGAFDWNHSAPHGAGRKMSRTQAKTHIDLDVFKKQMAHIYSSSVNEKTLDEAPNAYKNSSKIIKNINDTIDIYNIGKVKYNFKSY